MTTKITTTPTPLGVIDTINSVIDDVNNVSLSSLGVTATAAELNKMDGVTATTTELNYVDGVTSNVQTQLNNKLATSEVANSAGKVPRYSTDGHLVLPSGTELW